MSRLVQLVEGSVFAGEFRVVRPLAEGGMGAVYEVEQVGTGALRALKIMHPQLVNDERLRARFVQEARVSALIESDHVVQVVGAGVDATTGVPWLAMEMLKGETLSSFLARRGSLALWEVREVFSQLCHAVGAAHDVGVVHRDLKPENIFLSVPRREGVSFTVKVLDFGIAKLVAEAATHHTAAIGTPLWMAPEQTEVGMAVRPATDVWALGLLAFYALTGFHYWRVANAERLSAAALLREVVLDPLGTASERAAQYGRADRIPPGFDGWFARCVVRDVDQRFQHAREARDALEQIIAVATSSPLALRPALVVQPTPPPLTPAQTVGMDATLLVPSGSAGTPPGVSSTPLGRSPAASSDVAHDAVSPLRAANRTGEPTAQDDDEEPPVPPVRPVPRFAIVAAAVLLVAGIAFTARSLRKAPASPTTAPSGSIGPASKGTSSAFDAPKVTTKPCPPGMAAVPSGTFYMSAKGDPVTVPAFCIDAHEVSVADYDACVKKGHCTDTGLTSEPLCNWSAKTKKEKHPINCVDWDQAHAYCHAVAKRLPTMEEWEWTARGAEAGTTFPWGDDPPHGHMCWSGVLNRAVLGTCEVGSHPSGTGALGVHDLAGNVAEWVDAAPTTHESVRPLLGDHFLTDKPSFLKDLSGRTSVATRLVARKHHQNTIGFRCALTP